MDELVDLVELGIWRRSIGGWNSEWNWAFLGFPGLPGLDGSLRVV